jgi:hypothetical protein
MIEVTFSTVVVTLAAIAAASLLTYGVASWFWGTEYSRTNKAGDGGGPFGGVWVTLGPGFAVGFVALNYGACFMPQQNLIVPFAASALAGIIAGFWTMSRKRTK